MNARELFELAKKNDAQSVTAFTLLSNLAKLETNERSIEIKYYLGECYLNAYGVSQNRSIASTYFIEACIPSTDNPDLIALSNLAHLHLADESLRIDKIGDASRDLRQAAQGAMKATKNEGKEAGERLQKLASKYNNHPEVLHNYGIILKSGYSIQPHWTEAFTCFQRARELKSTEATYDLGKMHLASYTDGYHYVNNPYYNQAKGFELLFEAAQGGEAVAFRELQSQAKSYNLAKCYVGLCYEKGFGTEENSFAAARQYQDVTASYENNHDIAYARLAELQLVGKGGVALNVKAAIENFNKAVLLNTTQVHGTVHAFKRMHELTVLHPQEAVVYHYLGTYYRDGKGTTVDTAKAIEYLQKAAELNHIDSMIHLYLIYQHSWARGEAVEKNREQAVFWLFKCLEHPLASPTQKYDSFSRLHNLTPVANYEVGMCYLKGYGTVSDASLAKQSLLVAGNNNDERAMLVLAEMHETSHRTLPANLETAITWYAKLAAGETITIANRRKAFEAIRRLAHAHPKDEHAQHAYSLCLENGHGCPADTVLAAERYTTAEDLFRIATYYYKTEAGKVAFAKLESLSQTHPENVDAIYLLARCHEVGCSTPIAPKKALALFSSIIKIEIAPNETFYKEPVVVSQTCNLARMKVAEFYITGNVARQNLHFASRCLRYAARDWRETPSNAAIQRLEELAKQYPNDGAVQNSYGLCVKHGLGVPADKIKADACYKKAAEVNYVYGLFNYAHSLTEENSDQAISLYLQAAKGGYQRAFASLVALGFKHPAARIAVAECYDAGYCLPKPDHQAAVQRYQQEVDAGNDVAMVKLARLYLEGREGIPSDLKKALVLLNQAVRKYTANAAGSLAAFDLLLELSFHFPNNGFLFRSLGNAYYNKGKNHDYKKAFECFTRGAALGDTTCIGNLSAMYYNGFFVKQDYAQSLALRYQSLLQADEEFDHLKATRFADLQRYTHNAPVDYEIGMCHLHGLGTPASFKNALPYLKNASKNGDERAHYALGEAYEKGLQNTPVDLPHAISHYITAAHSNGQRAEGSAKALEALHRLHTAHPENVTIYNAIVKCHEKGLATPANLLQVAALQRQRVDRLYLNIDNQLIGSSNLATHLGKLRFATAALTTTIYDSLRTERARLLTAGTGLETPEIQHINHLLEAATALSFSQRRPELLIRSAKALASLKSDPSPHANHLQAVLTREQQISTFLRQFRADMQRLKIIVSDPQTTWYIKGWVREWAEGIPTSVKELRDLLSKIENANEQQLLSIHATLCSIIDRKETTEADKTRHPTTIVLYENIKLLLRGIDFNSILPEAVGSQEPIEMQEFVQVQQPPVPSAPPLSSPAYAQNQSAELAPPLSSTAYVLNQSVALAPPVQNQAPFYPVLASSVPVEAPPAYVTPTFSAPSMDPVLKVKPVNQQKAAAQVGTTWFLQPPAAAQPEPTFSFASVGRFFGKIGNLFKPAAAEPAAMQLRAPRGMEMNQFFDPNASAAPEQNQPPRPAPPAYVAPVAAPRPKVAPAFAKRAAAKGNPPVYVKKAAASLLPPPVANAPVPEERLAPPQAPAPKQAVLN